MMWALGLPASMFLLGQDATENLRLTDPKVTEAGIVAERIGIPARIDATDFIQKLHDRDPDAQSALLPAAPGEGGVWLTSYYTRQLAHVLIFYRPEVGQGERLICRLRSPDGIRIHRRWPAIRWCSETFGVTLPLEPPPPPIRTRD